MGKYTKTKAKYVKRTFHQDVNGGIITERDHLTLGSRNNFGKGKTPAYRDGNFVFTRSNVKHDQKHINLGSVVDQFNYDNVKNANPTSNNITINTNSNDIRDYCYYGSCVELVRASIENIIKTFPACLYSVDSHLSYPETNSDGEEEYINLEGYIIKNQFEIDIYHTDIDETEVENPFRFLSLSWRDYEIKINDDVYRPIGIYTVGDWKGDVQCPQNDQWEIFKKPVITVTINNSKLQGYQVEDRIVFVCKDKLVIRPRQEIINDYFNKLEGFEKQLLKLNTIPLYENTFITPVEGRLVYKYVKRDYIWPVVNDYCINIESPSYLSFVDKLYNMAEIYDKLWTNNLYRNMTHEAIKNFDWTFTKDYEDGEAHNNIEGGKRMMKILHVIGRVFDDIKSYIDAIKCNNKVSYDGFNNLPDALLTDKLELQGWDIKSTIPTLEDESDNLGDVYITEDTLKNIVEGANNKWFPTISCNYMSCSDNDTYFMRKLLLSTKRILSSKGTLNAIHMIMGMFGFSDENDYKLTQERYWIDPTKYPYDAYLRQFVKINDNKTIPIEYFEEDYFSGVPLKDVFLGNTQEHYIIPYYNSDKNYDGDFYFQCKGGWGKTIGKLDDINTDTTGYDYSETISYLHVVGNISNLMSINPNSVKTGDVFYVNDISGFIDYYEGTEAIDLSDISHYFRLNNIYNYDEFSGWDFIKISDIENGQDIQVKYLSNIITNTFGNNPHVGYGLYDCGKKYIDYMHQPFKYIIDNRKVREDLRDEAINLTWDKHNEVFEEKYELDDNKIVIFDENHENILDKYYINTKLLIFENKLDNKYYKEYFRDVIVHYLMQVIPSTTILVLKNL